MKALEGRNFFAQKVTGNQATVEYMPDQKAKMDKAVMRRSLCAYETSMPGSASEKLQMRADLEAMLNQTEEESLARASADMPQRHASLRESVAALAAWQDERPVSSIPELPSSSSACPPEEQVLQALEVAGEESERWQEESDQVTAELTHKPCSGKRVRLRGKQPAAELHGGPGHARSDRVSDARFL